MIEDFEVSIPEIVKDRMRDARSSSCHKMPLLTQFTSILHNLLTEATTISLGLNENVGGAEAPYKELAASHVRDRKQFLKLRRENEVLYN